MKKFLVPLFIMLATLFTLNSCEEKHDEVPSGTYSGNIEKVEPSKSEIYVKTDDGKTLELYFSNATQLTQNGQTVPFSALKEGQKVSVQVNNVGGSLDPIAVDIQE